MSSVRSALTRPTGTWMVPGSGSLIGIRTSRIPFQYEADTSVALARWGSRVNLRSPRTASGRQHRCGGICSPNVHGVEQDGQDGTVRDPADRGTAVRHRHHHEAARPILVRSAPHLDGPPGQERRLTAGDRGAVVIEPLNRHRTSLGRPGACRLCRAAHPDDPARFPVRSCRFTGSPGAGAGCMLAVAG
jgi:hypothetical protein